MDLSPSHLLFSFIGRIGRWQFWFGFMLVSLVQAVLVARLGVGMDGEVESAPDRLWLLTLLPTMLPEFALAVKRLHDRGENGWWAAPMLLPSWYGFLADAFDVLPISAERYSIIDLMFLVWIVIELGMLKGQSGDNAYGPDPLARDPKT